MSRRTLKITIIFNRMKVSNSFWFPGSQNWVLFAFLLLSNHLAYRSVTSKWKESTIAISVKSVATKASTVSAPTLSNSISNYCLNCLIKYSDCAWWEFEWSRLKQILYALKFSVVASFEKTLVLLTSGMIFTRCN